MDKLSYINEEQKQLNNTQFYEQTSSDLTGEVIHRVNLHVHDMLQKGQISQNAFNYLSTDIEEDTTILYITKDSQGSKQSTRKTYSLRQWWSHRKSITICGSFHRTLVPLLNPLLGTQPI